MEAKAYAKYVRMSPRKINLVLDLIRGKDVVLAQAILKHTPKAACEPVSKLLKSAMANAENNHDMDVAKLYVASCNYLSSFSFSFIILNIYPFNSFVNLNILFFIFLQFLI